MLTRSEVQRLIWDAQERIRDDTNGRRESPSANRRRDEAIAIIAQHIYDTNALADD